MDENIQVNDDTLNNDVEMDVEYTEEESCGIPLLPLIGIAAAGLGGAVIAHKFKLGDKITEMRINHAQKVLDKLSIKKAASSKGENDDHVVIE